MSGHDEWAAARDLAAAEAEQSAARGELDFLIDAAAHYARQASGVARAEATCGIAVVDQTAEVIAVQLQCLGDALAAVRTLAAVREKARR